jgi:integrase/recombinase XerD
MHHRLPARAHEGQSRRAPFRRGFPPPLTGPTVGTIVRAAIVRAGIKTRSQGAHQFRHALATDMLRKGATLTEIGSILRHQHPKTTGIYAKVDFDALRPLGLRWPGGAA